MGVASKFCGHYSFGLLSSKSANNLDSMTDQPKCESMADLVRASLRCPDLFFVSDVTWERCICGNRG